jgi:type I restriction enzyme, S subunit
MSSHEWSSTTLGDVLTVIRGVTYKKDQASSSPLREHIPILRATNIQNGLHFHDLVYVPKECVSDIQLLRRGDIVIAASSGSRTVVGKAAQLTIDWQGSFGAFCFGLRPKGAVEPRFLAWFLQTSEYRHRVSELAAGVNINNLRAIHIEQTPLRLPDLSEQNRIVTEIEKQFTRLDASVAALKRGEANLKRYRASALNAACEGRLVPTEAQLRRRTEGSPSEEPYESGKELLARVLVERRERLGRGEKYVEPKQARTGSPDALPLGWTWATFEQLCERVTVGFVGSMKHEYVEHGVPFLRSQNVRENRFDRQGLLHISASFHKRLSKSALQPGDLAIVRSGSVGVTCVIPESLPEANCSDLVLIQRPIGLVPQYGAYYMNSVAKRHVEAGKVGVALIHFNTKSVAALVIPLPPLAEQHRIVAEVERRLSVVDELERVVEANLQRAKSLRQSILHRAFSGNL